MTGDDAETGAADRCESTPLKGRVCVGEESSAAGPGLCVGTAAAAAATYALCGLSVFALGTGADVGLSRATRDPDGAARQWIDRPDAGIGMATGWETGLFAVQVEPSGEHPGWIGPGTRPTSPLWDLEHCVYDVLPETASLLMPTGAHVRLFRLPPLLTIRTGGGEPISPYLNGITVEGEGGYVDLPRPNAADGPRWLSGPFTGDIAYPPPWLYELLAGWSGWRYRGVARRERPSFHTERAEANFLTAALEAEGRSLLDDLPFDEDFEADRLLPAAVTLAELVRHRLMSGPQARGWLLGVLEQRTWRGDHRTPAQIEDLLKVAEVRLGASQ